jgi:hypothetical protein
MRIKLKTLTAIKGDQTMKFQNKSIKTGNDIPIEMDMEKQRVFIRFNDLKHMVVNLDRLSAYEYEVDDGSSAPAVLAANITAEPKAIPEVAEEQPQQ